MTVKPSCEELEQKIAVLENEIRERDSQQTELEKIFNFSLDIIGAGNLDGYFTKINSSLTEILGYTKAEFFKKPFLFFVHEDDVQKTSDALSSAAKKSQQLVIENRYRCMDRSYKWIEWKILSIIEENKFIVVGRDITSRKQTREMLEQERDVLQAVMDGARKSHLVYLDREFNFIRVNSTYAKTCGYTPEEMIGKNHFELYPHPENEAIFAKVRDTGEIFETSDKPFVFPDQPERGVTYWDWTLTPIKDDTEHVTGLVFSLFETTERRIAKEALLIERNNLFKALSEIKTLRGILPICSVCKKIRDDKGYWNQLELYFEKYSGASFSHGMCPECTDNLYRDEEWYIEMKQNREKDD